MKLIQLFMLVLCFSLTTGLQAQQEKSKKKVRIVKKRIDENGKETIEETEVEGEEAERLLEEMEIEVEVDEDGNQKEVRVETRKRVEIEIDDEEGDEDVIMIQLDGQSWEEFQQGEEFKQLPEEVQQKLKTVNINIEEESSSTEKEIIIKKIKDGEEEVIKWSGKEGDELPEDIQKMLDKEGIKLHEYKDREKEVHVMRVEKGHSSNRARLGVKANSRNNGGTTIEQVTDDSAAAAAGLKTGDTIKKINGLAVRDVSDLIAKIGKYEPGEHIMIEYVRGGKTKTTTAILKGNKEEMHKMIWTEENN